MAKTATKAAPDKDKVYTLSLRLKTDGYRRLRRFASKQEQETGERVTHQQIFEAALVEYLTKNGGD